MEDNNRPTFIPRGLHSYFSSQVDGRKTKSFFKVSFDPNPANPHNVQYMTEKEKDLDASSSNSNSNSWEQTKSSSSDSVVSVEIDEITAVTTTGSTEITIRERSDSIEFLGNQLGNLQLTNAKKEVQKSRSTLTKEDRELLLLNSNEFYFKSGSQVFENGSNDSTVYWLQSGQLKISDEFGPIAVMGPGAIITTRKSTFNGIAVGNVILRQLDITYVSRLLENDYLLAIRFYRRLGASIATILRSVMTEMERSDKIQSIAPEIAKKIKVKKDKKKVHSLSTGQVFNVIDGSQTLVAHLKNTKIKLVSNTLGHHAKKRFYYKDIESITKSSDTSITLITKQKKGKTLFLKNHLETSQLYELLSNIKTRFEVPSSKIHSILPMSQTSNSNYNNSSLRNSGLRNSGNVENENTSSSDSNPSPSPSPSSSSSSLSNSTLREKNLGELLFGGSKNNLEHHVEDCLRDLSETISYKAGEVIVAEGGLFQRIYQIEKGEVLVSSSATGMEYLHIMIEGDVFGEIQIVQLRPIPITLVAKTDVVVRMITGYKIFGLIEKDLAFGARIFRQVARALEGKFSGHLEIRKWMNLNPGKTIQDFNLNPNQ